MEVPRKALRIAHDRPTESRPSARVVEFVKGGHRYSFRYESSAELSMICALLSAALDPRLNIDLEDARKLMDALGLGRRETPQA